MVHKICETLYHTIAYRNTLVEKNWFTSSLYDTRLLWNLYVKPDISNQTQ